MTPASPQAAGCVKETNVCYRVVHLDTYSIPAGESGNIYSVLSLSLTSGQLCELCFNPKLDLFLHPTLIFATLPSSRSSPAPCQLLL